MVLVDPVIFLRSQLSRLKSSSSSSSSSSSEDISDVEAETGLGAKIVSFFGGLVRYGVIAPLSLLYSLASLVLFVLTVIDFGNVAWKVRTFSCSITC